MSTFSTPIPHGTALERLTPSAPLPATTPPLRLAGDPLMWIGVPAGTAIAAFATGIVVNVQAPSVAGITASACTIFQLSPLPQANAAAFNAIPGGLPVQIVIANGSVSSPATDELLLAGGGLVTAPAGSGSTAFVAVAFQDRLCRDALTWAEAVNSNHVPQEIFEQVKKQLSDEELIDLTLAVGNLNTWNKLNIALSPMKPGSYTVGQFG